MGSKIEFVDSTQLYTTKYIRNSKAVSVLWAVFTICYTILVFVAFTTNEWLGTADNDNEPNPSKIGLWSMCHRNAINGDEQCIGNLDDFLISIPNIAFKVATICVGFSLFLALCICMSIVSFCFCTSTTVFRFCGTVQLMSAIALLLGCSCYPFGWSEIEVKRICGVNAGQFRTGDCNIRWAYILAIISCFDAFVLSGLAFILATKHVKLQAIINNMPRISTYNRNKINNGTMMSTSRKSLNLHPVLMMHPNQNRSDDTYSQFSQGPYITMNRSRTLSTLRYPNSTNHSFQL